MGDVEGPVRGGDAVERVSRFQENVLARARQQGYTGEAPRTLAEVRAEVVNHVQEGFPMDQVEAMMRLPRGAARKLFEKTLLLAEALKLAKFPDGHHWGLEPHWET